jgi:hypothetical protein
MRVKRNAGMKSAPPADRGLPASTAGVVIAGTYVLRFEVAMVLPSCNISGVFPTSRVSRCVTSTAGRQLILSTGNQQSAMSIGERKSGGGFRGRSYFSQSVPKTNYDNQNTAGAETTSTLLFTHVRVVSCRARGIKTENSLALN